MLLSKLIMWALGVDDIRNHAKISYTNENTNTNDEEAKMKSNTIVTPEPKKSTDLSFEIDEVISKIKRLETEKSEIRVPSREEWKDYIESSGNIFKFVPESAKILVIIDNTYTYFTEDYKFVYATEELGLWTWCALNHAQIPDYERYDKDEIIAPNFKNDKFVKTMFEIGIPKNFKYAVIDGERVFVDESENPYAAESLHAFATYKDFRKTNSFKISLRTIQEVTSIQKIHVSSRSETYETSDVYVNAKSKLTPIESEYEKTIDEFKCKLEEYKHYKELEEKYSYENNTNNKEGGDCC